MWGKPPRENVLLAQLPPKREYVRRAESSEHKEQSALIDWWDAASAGYGVPRFALYAIPNGAHLAGGYAAASKLKAEGMRPGMLDLALAVPRDQFHGLYIEMKYGKNKPSEDQIKVGGYLKSAGYHVCTCWTADSAIQAVKEYLG